MKAERKANGKKKGLFYADNQFKKGDKMETKQSSAITLLADFNEIVNLAVVLVGCEAAPAPPDGDASLRERKRVTEKVAVSV